MDILDKNLKLLREKNPKLATKIEQISELKSQFEIKESMSGEPVLYKNGINLHDKIDPEQEAIDLMKEIKDNISTSFNFIYGLGLGYVLKRFNKSLSGIIIVFEPDIEVLRLTLELVDFTEELSSNNVFIFDNLEDITSFYSKYFFHNYKISTTIQNTYKDYEFDEAKKFIQHLAYLHGLYTSNYDMYWNKHHNWVNSLFNNLPYLTKYDELKALKDKYKNKPALIISAGPSLDENIDLIKKYQDNFVIFCVGTALQAVIKNDIKPDFVCFIEYLPVTAKMISGLDVSNSSIILQPITCKEVFEADAKNKFMFYADNDDAALCLAGIYNINPKDYINRGTVSINALVSAKILGCNPIILTGQDLAYTNNKCYASSSIYGDYEFKDKQVKLQDTKNFSDKTALSEETITRRVNHLNETLVVVKGQNGEDLLAPGDFASFIKYFEEVADIYKDDVKLINSSPGGAQINGYENLTFDKIIETYAKNPVDKTVDFEPYNPDLHNNILTKEIEKTINLFEKNIKNIFEKGNKIVKKIATFDTEDKDFFMSNKLDAYELIKCYELLGQQKLSKLLNLLVARNKFFINKYISKPQDVNFLNNLLLHLMYLFGEDYENFILPKLIFLKDYVHK